MFSDAVISILKNAGWSPDRRIDVKPLIQPLEEEGFRFNPLAVAILTTFGGLEVRPPKTHDDIYLKGHICFDPEGASGRQDVIAYWEYRLATPLSPIAVDDRLAIYLVSETGTVFAIVEHELYFVEEDFEAAMENVLMRARHHPKVIGVVFCARPAFSREIITLCERYFKNDIGGVESAAWGEHRNCSWDSISSDGCVDGLFPRLLRFYFDELHQSPSNVAMSDLCLSLKQLLARLTNGDISCEEFEAGIEELIEKPLIIQGRIKYEFSLPPDAGSQNYDADRNDDLR